VEDIELVELDCLVAVGLEDILTGLSVWRFLIERLSSVLIFFDWIAKRAQIAAQPVLIYTSCVLLCTVVV
jgi:hypothetical protein